MSCRNRKVAADLAPATLRDPFVVATSLDTIKPDAKSRQFIRRYVTKGKKINRPVRRKPVLHSWFDGGELSHVHEGGDRGSSFPRRELVMHILEPRMLQVLRDFVPVMVNVMYPIEHCVDVAIEKEHWHNDLAHDPTYAQSVFDSARVYFDIVKAQDQQLQKLVLTDTSLRPLLEQLAGTEILVTDSMIFTVVSLALISEAFEELEATLTHLRGLHAMVKLRGGVAALAGKRSLQIKCCRIDLVLAMRTGERPILFEHEQLTWKPYLARSPVKTPTYPRPWRKLVEGPDIRLINTYLDLREFTTSVNLAHQTGRKIQPTLFQEVLISVQYRLHHLTYPRRDIQETLRLAMLAFSASLFLDIHSRPLRCHQLAATLTEALRNFDQDRRDNSCLELELCLVFLGRIFVLDLPERQLCLEERIVCITRALKLSAWMEVRCVLKGFLWIDMIHDEAGRRIFETLTESHATKGSEGGVILSKVGCEHL